MLPESADDSQQHRTDSRVSAAPRALKLPVEVPVDRRRGDRSDLRWRRRKELIDRILDRGAWLPAADRMLIEAIYRDNRTAVEVAPMLKVRARTLRRRVRQLVRRVLSREFAFVVNKFKEAARLQQIPKEKIGDAERRRKSWSLTTNRIAEQVVLNGRSLREAAEALQLSLHSVRRHRDDVRAFFREGDPGERV